MPADAPFLTRADLRPDLTALGLRPGDAVPAHCALSRGNPGASVAQAGWFTAEHPPRVGAADSVLVDAAATCAFAVGWMERPR